MNFGLSEEQQMIVDTVRNFVEKEYVSSCSKLFECSTYFPTMLYIVIVCLKMLFHTNVIHIAFKGLLISKAL